MSIIEGKWSITHLSEHKTMFDNLISLLSDLEHAYPLRGTNQPIQEDKNGIPFETIIPRRPDGTPDWNNISVAFIIQWYMMNSNKITHIHKEEIDVK